MTIRKDDPAMGVKSRPAMLDKKGFPMGGNIETDDDMPFNSQLPPGQHIENQMLSQDVKRIAGLSVYPASRVLASGTKNLN